MAENNSGEDAQDEGSNCHGFVNVAEGKTHSHAIEKSKPSASSV